MSILAKILASKREEVRMRTGALPLSALQEQLSTVAAPRSMVSALRRRPNEPIRVLAEFKRASPSAGPIAANAHPETVARGYEVGGADAISVLTDEVYFDGHLSFLPRIRAVVDVPLLRKDFVISTYQVVEARANGADAVLLIASALDDGELQELFACVREHGMDALVEVHDEQEAERAVRVGAQLIGVNHRNLATFAIDLGLTARLRAQVPDNVVLVGESGIRTREEVAQLERAGAHAILVGESLMRSDAPGDLIRILKGNPCS